MKTTLYLKTVLLCFGIVVISTSVMAIIGYRGFSHLAERQQQDYAERILLLNIEAFADAITEVNRNCHWLVDQVENAMNASNPLGDLVPTFYSMMLHNPAYSQVRLLNAPPEGKELIRLQRTDSGEIELVEDATRLQSKGHRNYYKMAVLSSPHQVLLSDVDLNMENGQIEIPYKPTIRLVTQLLPREEANAPRVLVINIDFEELVRQVAHQPAERSVSQFLLKDNGVFIQHPNPSFEFGDVLGHGSTLSSLHPEVEGFLNSDQSEAMFKLPAGHAHRAGRLYLKRHHPFANQPGRTLISGLLLSDRIQNEELSQLLIHSLLFILVLVILVGFVSVLLVKRILLPISSVTRAIQHFSEKEERIQHIEGSSTSEVNSLITSFEKMRKKILQKERNLKIANRKLKNSVRDLRNFNHAFTHDLSEPVHRISALVDLAVHEGGVLTDDFRQAILQQNEWLTISLNDYRELSHLSKTELLRQNIHLQELVSAEWERWLKGLQDSTCAERLQLKLELHGEIVAYLKLVRVLFREIFGNIAAFTTDRGDLEVTNKAEEPHFIRIVWKGPHLISSQSAEMGFSLCRKIIMRHSGEFRIEIQKDSFSIGILFEQVKSVTRRKNGS